MIELDAKLAALSNEAQDLVVEACDLCAQVGAKWDAKDLTGIAHVMRDAAGKHRRVAELYDRIADECAKAQKELS